MIHLELPFHRGRQQISAKREIIKVNVKPWVAVSSSKSCWWRCSCACGTRPSHSEQAAGRTVGGAVPGAVKELLGYQWGFVSPGGGARWDSSGPKLKRPQDVGTGPWVVLFWRKDWLSYHHHLLFNPSCASSIFRMPAGSLESAPTPPAFYLFCRAVEGVGTGRAAQLQVCVFHPAAHLGTPRLQAQQ